jgi:ATP-dependent helicase/nuclease subunit A
MADPKTRRIGSKVGDYKSVMFNQVMNQKKDEQTDEAMRLLYVAMTRARDYLALCLPSQTKGRSGDSWAAWCRSALAFNSPTIPAGIREVREGVPYRVRDISDPENLAQ